MINVHSYAYGEWVASAKGSQAIHSAVNATQIAHAGNSELDTARMLDFARVHGSPALRKLSFHDRAKRLKALATYLHERRDYLFELSTHTGATKKDASIDIDGGIGTLFVYASKARRELPDDTVVVDGDTEQLSRKGSFLGQHVYTSKHGVAVHINAFNFPVWGMLEKMAPALLAGVSVIVKPATATSYVTEAAFKLIIESELLPAGAVQLIAGSSGKLLDQINSQDMVSFTGSAQTALMLRSNPSLLSQSIPFVAEQDSLNATIMGPDAEPGTETFNAFINEVITELTTKTGQKCTAIRRILAPKHHIKSTIEALNAKLSAINIGNPALATTHMGPLVSIDQRNAVLEASKQIALDANKVFGSAALSLDEQGMNKGAFISPMLFHCEHPKQADHVHRVEAFGPVATIMPYNSITEACELLNLGGGSLVASVFTQDTHVAKEVVTQSAAFHGRLYFNNQHSASEATGHGSPLPHMVHGGPGRAGGGEELGGTRAVLHCMQRTAIQGSPDLLTAVARQWVPGSAIKKTQTHPFRKTFHELELGHTVVSESRTISLEDIEHFAHFTGDTFYAHMDEQAAAQNPFFPGRVAHGYLLLSFAAGLFVDPDPGPVLANTGLNSLSFQKPVSPGDSIQVRLTVKFKKLRNEEYGEVRWHVQLTNQHDEQVAEYELHTMNAL